MKIGTTKPKVLKHKGSYIGFGVGPINQSGTILTETQIRDAARRLSRGLNDESLEGFMSKVRYKGIHQVAKDPSWEWCPLKSFKGYCQCCTHIFVVSVSDYQTINTPA